MKTKKKCKLIMVPVEFDKYKEGMILQSKIDNKVLHSLYDITNIRELPNWDVVQPLIVSETDEIKEGDYIAYDVTGYEDDTAKLIYLLGHVTDASEKGEANAHYITDRGQWHWDDCSKIIATADQIGLFPDKSGMLPELKLCHDIMINELQQIVNNDGKCFLYMTKNCEVPETLENKVIINNE